MVIRRLVATGTLALVTAAAGHAYSDQSSGRPTWMSSGWEGFRYEDLGLFVEGSAGPALGVRLDGGEVSVGYAARLGVRSQAPHRVSSGFTAVVPEVLFGEVWSLEGTFRALRGEAGPSRLFVGLSFSFLNLVGERTDESRLRGPTLLGVALPEVGFWFPGGGVAAPYISYSAPFAWLLSEHVAVEMRPSLTFAFRSDGAPNDVYAWLSAAVMWR